MGACRRACSQAKVQSSYPGTPRPNLQKAEPPEPAPTSLTDVVYLEVAGVVLNDECGPIERRPSAWPHANHHPRRGGPRTLRRRVRASGERAGSSLARLYVSPRPAPVAPVSRRPGTPHRCAMGRTHRRRSVPRRHARALRLISSRRIADSARARPHRRRSPRSRAPAFEGTCCDPQLAKARFGF